MHGGGEFYSGLSDLRGAKSLKLFAHVFYKLFEYINIDHNLYVRTAKNKQVIQIDTCKNIRLKMWEICHLKKKTIILIRYRFYFSI